MFKECFSFGSLGILPRTSENWYGCPGVSLELGLKNLTQGLCKWYRPKIFSSLECNSFCPRDESTEFDSSFTFKGFKSSHTVECWQWKNTEEDVGTKIKTILTAGPDSSSWLILWILCYIRPVLTRGHCSPDLSNFATQGNPAVNKSWEFGSLETTGGIFSQFLLSYKLILLNITSLYSSLRCHVNVVVVDRIVLVWSERAHQNEKREGILLQRF